ncbi:hypothetical protein [Yersinia rochesterensis]|uniref:hypothetical protein n=1 Tax=Yersinia rochesterensis TaxID=1604335 RepID=UPI0011AACA69|nr:hypothetical protein [Yersinia rochesterensis]
MAPIEKVKLADDFSFGSQNSPEFVDVPFMAREHLQALALFVHNVTNNIPLKGKNKPSWLNDDQDRLPHTHSYEMGNYWHYHCGPNYSNQKIKSLTYNLSMNLDGLTSPEVIHYQKLDDKNILVVGFSPYHVPFPPSDKPGFSNPLFPDDD